jgi:hypothetical protein
MRRQDVTVSSATASPPLPVDYRAQVFNIGIGCVLSAGASLTYSVQHTFDDVFAAGYNPSTDTWFDHATLTNRTTNANSSYDAPITAVRVNVTVYGSGSVTVTFLQASGQS